ncbi:hypothetical protein HUK80_09625 [Flavobacterium sp. MAH-1]|uniref:Tetratricopeptide repeat-containing protein n=1 Tax=Flavobacterium agri TaxID=2743471 RepID=A0A7Y9C5C7_9FLAO|nr:hypothetical protein [Flavobacterium agri]NUY81152.1 hypothetical protein [Flavobacterium agri]NYA71176.1 hypothetical protein [Flavobacterium agri]
MKTITTIALFICTLTFGQSKYEQGMTKAFELWGQGKDTEASAMFERIAAAEQNQWLPNYYVAFVNTISSFSTKDRATVSALLDKAQKALDVEMIKNPENSEILVMQAMIYTGWVAFDPMTNGMKYSGQVMELYDKAQKLDPNNPRAVFGKAEYEMGGAKYFGTDTAPICAEIKRSLELFAKFKPETPFHPKWGQDRAEAAAKECEKK